jgi:hypothetical protein
MAKQIKDWPAGAIGDVNLDEDEVAEIVRQRDEAFKQGKLPPHAVLGPVRIIKPGDDAEGVPAPRRGKS